MNYIFAFITMSLIYCIVNLILNKIEESKVPFGVVEYPKIMFIIGLIGSLVFLLFAFLSFKQNENGVSIFFLVFACLGIYLIGSYFNSKLFYNSEGFVKFNYFNK